MSRLHVRNIANDIQTINGIHLSDEAWDKIRQGVEGAIQCDRESLAFERDMYKRRYEELKDADYELQHNEIVQWLKREIPKQPAFAEAFSLVLFTMYKIKNGKSVR